MRMEYGEIILADASHYKGHNTPCFRDIIFKLACLLLSVKYNQYDSSLLRSISLFARSRSLIILYQYICVVIEITPQDASEAQCNYSV